MKTTTRTDCHSPKNIKPENYTYVAMNGFRFENWQAAAVEREIFQQHKAQTGGNYSAHQHGGNCDICGSVNAIYLAIFYHALSNSYIQVGCDCAAKLDFGCEEAFKRAKTAEEAYKTAKAGKLKAQGTLEVEGLTKAWAVYEANVQTQYEEKVICDMVGKLVTYGNLSPKQFAYLKVLLGKIENRAQVQQERAVEAAQAEDVKEGRLTLEVEVLSTKTQSSDFGDVLKMLCKVVKGGYKVWGTVPAAVANEVKHGTKLELTATFKKSPTDNKFGFFSRPYAKELVS